MTEPIFRHLTREEAKARRKSRVVTSASALRDFKSCKRLWWFKKIAKMPPAKIYTGATAFGTILHAVVERWMLADEQGYDANGELVNLYPPGWDTTEEYVSALQLKVPVTLDTEACALLQGLVAKGIETGVLKRMPGRRLEDEFWYPIIDGVEIMGYIDVHMEGDRLEDHKTIGRKQYRSGARALKTDIQLVSYAKISLEARRAKGLPDPEKIWIAWNQFTKDVPEVRTVEVGLTPEYVDQFWDERIVPAAEEMKILAKHTDLDSWRGVDGNTSHCQAYGGCSMRLVCAGMQTPEVYRKNTLKKLRRQVGLEVEAEVAQPKETKPMDYQARMAKIKAAKERAAAARNGEKPETKKPDVATQKPNVEPQKPEVKSTASKEGNWAPWAFDGCRACRQNAAAALAKGEFFVYGVKPNGLTCPICTAHAKKTDGVKPNDFDMDGGTYVGEPKDPDSHQAFAFVHGQSPTGPLPESKKIESKGTVTDPAPVESEGEWVVVAEDLSDDVRNQAVMEFGNSVKSHGSQFLAREAWVDQVHVFLDSLEQAATAAPSAELSQEEEPSEREEPDAPATKPKGGDKASAGRPRASFSLFRGCAPIKGFNKTIRLSEIMAVVADELETETGKPYFTVDTWKRRDMVAQIGSRLAEQYKGYSILATSQLSPDMNILYETLSALSSKEVHASV